MAISITTLSGGNTPADGSDPRTFPAIWNATASDLEGVAADLDTLEASALTPANVTTPSDGEILAYDSGTSEWVNQALESAQLPAGSILQVVRATDTTTRSTTSTSFTDVTGMSVTITPTSATSNLIVIASYQIAVSTANTYFRGAITDSSNNVLSGAGGHFTGATGSTDDWNSMEQLIGYVGAGSTSARTYKLRFAKGSGGAGPVQVRNTDVTGQMFAIEVAA